MLDEITNANLEIHYLGYFLKWVPKSVFIMPLKTADLGQGHLELKALTKSILV